MSVRVRTMASSTQPGPASDGLAHEIDFGDGRRAMLVQARGDEAAPGLLAKLGLAAGERRPVIVVSGGADNLHEPQLAVARSLLGPAIGLAAHPTDAVVVDGGTAAGVMTLTGAERARDGTGVEVLLGVAPGGRVALPGEPAEGRTALDAHHSHFVLADSDEWGGETELLVTLAAELAGDAPVVMVLVGGGAGTRLEAGEAVSHGWPLFVVEGTGGAADEIAALWRRHRERRRRPAARLLPARWRTAAPRPAGDIEDPPLRRVVSHGDVRVVSDREPRALARRLLWELQRAATLKDAWVLFATYDHLAGALRATFERFQRSILLLGVLATLLALVHDQTGGVALHWLVVAAPVAISVLIALANRRAAGKRWVLLRAAAESIKSEIYRYRSATGIYAGDAPSRPDSADRQRLLSSQLKAIEAKLMQTDVSGGPLTPYRGPLPPAMYGSEAHDDGLSPLDADRYVEMRLADQLSYYRGKVDDLDRRRSLLQLLTIVAGGAGTLLAAAGFEIWIGLTTAISGAALAHLGYLQVDNTIIAYNQSAAQLAGLVREYRAAKEDQPSPEALHLVTRGEAVLTTELSGWVQQMSDAMHELQQQQSEAVAKTNGAPDQPDRDATPARAPRGG